MARVWDASLASYNVILFTMMHHWHLTVSVISNQQFLLTVQGWCFISHPLFSRVVPAARVSSICRRWVYPCDPAMRLLSLHRGGVSLVSDFSGHGKTVSQGQPQNDKSLDSGLQPEGATCRLPITVLKSASGSQPPASQPTGFAPAGSAERPMTPLQVVPLRESSC